MLKEYPRFEKGEVMEKFDNLSKKEKESLEEYLKYRQARGVTTKETLGDIKRYILHIRFIVQKPLEKLDLKDLRGFLALLNSTQAIGDYAKNDIKIDLKNFLKWKFKDWNMRFAEFEDIKLVSKPMNEKKLNASAILHKEDIENIMKHETKMVWKAFFMTQYEAGLRTKETRFLKWSDINFNVDDQISELNIYATKTDKARTIFVKEATFYLRKLKEEQENLGTKGVYVFHTKRDLNKPIDKGTVSIWARGLAKKSGKYFWSYLLRHSRATELYLLADENKIAENTASKFMGHSTSMKETYLHLDKNKIKTMLKDQVYKLEEMPPKEKREFELMLEAQKKELENIRKNQEEQQRELEKRKNFDLLLNDLFTDPRIQKILAEKKKIGVLGT